MPNINMMNKKSLKMILAYWEEKYNIACEQNNVAKFEEAEQNIEKITNKLKTL
jgi:hypothetical protein